MAYDTCMMHLKYMYGTSGYDCRVSFYVLRKQYMYRTVSLMYYTCILHKIHVPYILTSWWRHARVWVDSQPKNIYTYNVYNHSGCV